MTTASKKAALRKELVLKRDALSVSYRKTAGEKMAESIVSFPEFSLATCLLCYFPVKSEVDLTNLFSLALREGKELAFPVCIGKEMQFYTVKSLEELVPGRFGIPTPPVSEEKRVTDAATCLCLVPALSADKNGARLGYGGGYYDRFLKEHRPLLSVVCVYEPLFSLAPLPTEEFDVRADAVVTEERIRNVYEA